MSDIKYRNTFEHDSFLGFLNAFKVKDTNWILKPGQRPPYPIIIADPTISQVVSNLNKADFGLFLTVSAIGFFASRASMGNLYSTEYLRRRGFSIAWNSFMMMGGLLALMNSNNRLTGFVDNGLQWRRRETTLQKYDFTKNWEKGSIWSFFRLRDN